MLRVSGGLEARARAPTRLLRGSEPWRGGNEIAILRPVRRLTDFPRTAVLTSALALSALNAAVLWHRIRKEEAALHQIPAWREAMDAMGRAGMEAKNSVFVSTPYPFKKAVTYQLRKRGVRTIVPRLRFADPSLEGEGLVDEIQVG